MLHSQIACHEHHPFRLLALECIFLLAAQTFEHVLHKVLEEVDFIVELTRKGVDCVVAPYTMDEVARGWAYGWLDVVKVSAVSISRYRLTLCQGQGRVYASR